MSAAGASPAPVGGQRRSARTVAAAAVATIVLLLDLVSFSQLIFAGPLAGSRTAGLSAMLLAYILGSLVFAAVRRAAPVALSFIGAAAIVQAAIAAAVAEHLAADGVADPEVIGRTVLLACGAATAATGLIFLSLGALRASLLAQLLPYPVLTGFLGGVGVLLLQRGLEIGSRLADRPTAWSAAIEPGALLQVGLTLAVGACAFTLPRRVRHWTVYPGVILGTFAATHAALWAAGLDVGAAQAAGWLLDPMPEGSLLRLPAARDLGALDPGLLVPLLPKIATQAVVAAIIQILFVLSVELELQRDLDIDRMFVAAGWANLLGGAFGSTPMGLGRTSTLLVHTMGGRGWLGWSLTLVAMAGLLVLGAGPVALLPRPLAGGTLIALGLNLLTILALAARATSRWEAGIALAVCAATAGLGAAPGFLVGIALAIVIFAVQYARIPAVRLALTGADRPSSVIRAPDIARTLSRAGGRTRIYTLQGYLFFLNAQAVCRRAGAERDLRSLVLDFRECVGLDSSALVAFRKVALAAEQRGFDLLLVHLGPAAAHQVARSGLAGRPRVRVLDTLDHALQRAEAALLAEVGIAVEAGAASFALHIARAVGGSVGPGELAPYLAARTLAAGETLLRQGDTADALYFVESGIVSIELEVSGRPNLRLRTTTAGTVIGEVAMMQGGRRTATAIAQDACRVVALDRAALDRMERVRPDLALRVQRFLILEIAGKLADTNRLLEAEMR